MTIIQIKIERKIDMKKNLRIKSAAFISTLFIVTGAFTACGKADRRDIERDLSENVTASDSATKSDAEPVTNQDIPEKLTYTISGANGTIKVNADVYAEGYGNVSTYNIKAYEKNDAWLDGYAKKFFDDGEYENVKPYKFCSMDELRQEKSFCEELLSQYDEESNAYFVILQEKAAIELQIENYVETEYVKNPDDKLIYEYDTDIALPSGKVLNCKRAHLKGEADGKLWYLNYERGAYSEIGDIPEDYFETWGTYAEQKEVLYGFCPENIPNIMYTMDMDLGFPNTCERETAEKEAEKLLEDFGLENMKQVNITPLRVDNDDDSCMLDGYIMTYAPSVNGVDFLYGSMAEYVGVDNSNTEAALTNIAEQPFVKIGVSSAGVFEFFVYGQYEIGDALAGSSSMLSFEQMDSQMKTLFQSFVDAGDRMDVEISEVRFGYVCITYDGTSYAMVPAWRYYMDTSGNNTRFPFVTVCALDGSYFFTENGGYFNEIFNSILVLD